MSTESWSSPDAPNGRVLSFSLGSLDEDRWLLPGGKAALYGLGDGPDSIRRDRTPLVLVHGINGSPADLQAVVDRLRTGAFQVYVLAYADYTRRTSENGDDLADALRALSAQGFCAGGEVRIVAHSMGGIVARRALNSLTLGLHRGLERFQRIQLIAIDTPWHGFVGPADRGLQAFMMKMARPFMPDGLEDMRAASSLFQGDPKSPDPAARAGLFGVPVDPRVQIELIFAEAGDEALDYTEGVLRPLATAIAEGADPATAGNTRLVNFWRALQSASVQFQALQRELSAIAGHGSLDPSSVLAVLARVYPRFPGDHTSVLLEHPGRFSALDHLQSRLA